MSVTARILVVTGAVLCAAAQTASAEAASGAAASAPAAAPAAAPASAAAANPALDPKAVLLSLVSAEQSFAETAGSKGAKTAFMKYLSTDATFYSRLGPVNAHTFWTDRPDRQGSLKWDPIFAEATSAGDLGITTGPWSFVPANASEPTIWGEFVSVWAREPDGTWKVVVDSGVTHPKPDGAAPALKMRKPAFDVQPRNTKQEVDEARASLAASDDVYLRSIAAYKKRGPAVLVMTEKIRMLREGKAPVTGMEEVKASMISSTAPVSCSRESIMVSKGAEIGFTMGTCAMPGSGPAKTAKGKPGGASSGETVSYVRIWRWWGWANSAAQRWELVIDLALPFAPAAPAGTESAQRASTQ